MIYIRAILKEVLSGEATEIVVENIHEYLTDIGKKIREGKIPLEEFIIYKVCLSVHHMHTTNQSLEI